MPCRLIDLFVMWLLMASAPAFGQHPTDSFGTSVSSAISTHIEAAPTPEAVALRRLYGTGPAEPLWIDGNGRATSTAEQALDMLRLASTEGLDPADYDADAIARLGKSPALRPADHARFDVSLSVAMLRYLTHLHAGRTDARRLSYAVPSHAADDDVPTRLRDAISTGSIGTAAAGVAPSLAQYAQLRTALARYRTAAAGASPTLHFDRPVRPGDTNAALPALQARLAAEGDLEMSRDGLAPPSAFDTSLVEAVKRFQKRHGLDPDGVIGTATQAALSIPLSHRVRQIELAMERLRWLPPLHERPLVAINIPMFRLWAVDMSMPRPVATLEMAVIVGRSLDTRTPVLMKEMKQVIFRPWWNVPRSIVRKEIIPAVSRDPRYLDRHDMEIVRGAGDDATPVVADSQNLALLQQGALRLRQRPGPRNSLGLVKFVFPNDENVYLHGTPAQQLFERTRRDFSHGCVRLQDPVALAEWVLAGSPQWDRARIIAAMQGSRTVSVPLPRPMRVILFYVTAVVTPSGDLHFADDIYGHDRALEAALAHRDRRHSP